MLGAYSDAGDTFSRRHAHCFADAFGGHQFG